MAIRQIKPSGTSGSAKEKRDRVQNIVLQLQEKVQIKKSVRGATR